MNFKIPAKLFPRPRTILRAHSTANVALGHLKGETMRNYLVTCAVLFVALSSPVNAQEIQEAVLQRIAVPGASFDLVVALPKSPAVSIHVSPEAAFIPLIGGELGLGFESWESFLRAFDELRWPVGTVDLQRAPGKSSASAAVYAVPAAP